MTEVLKAVKLSNIVYAKNLLNYSKLGFNDIKECIVDNDYAVVVSNDKEIYVCFRGSDDVNDWIDNISLTSCYYEGYGRLHHGFAECYFGKPETKKTKLGLNKYYLPVLKKEVVSKVNGMKDVVMDVFRKMFSPTKRIVICGHSKAGTFAELFAYDLYKLGYFPSLYTFGCPRVGKKEFHEKFNATSIRYSRFINGNDPVPHLPRSYMGFKDTVSPYHFADGNYTFLWFGDKKDHDIGRYEEQVIRHFP